MTIDPTEAAALKRANDARADQAFKVLRDYDESGNYDTALIDLLGDLQHLAERRGWDFADLLGTATLHFHAEGGGGQDPDDITLSVISAPPC